VRRAIAAFVLLAGLASAVAFVYISLSREREYRRLIAAGDMAVSAELLGQAIEAFSGAIALKPDSMLGYLKRGETYRRRADLPAALRDLRVATRLDPAAPRPLEQLGDVTYALERFPQAASYYESYVRLDDRSARVLYKLGLTRYRLDSLPAAMTALRRALALDAEFAQARYLLGMCLQARDRPRDAATELEGAVHLAPGLISAREELARVYRGLGRRSAELDQLEALAALEPTRAERQIAVALAHARVGRTDLAIATLRRAADRFPDRGQVQVALGRIWLAVATEQGDRAALDQAVATLQRAVTMTPPTSEALALLGRALLLADRITEAEEVLVQATATFPVDPAAFLYLADAASTNGDRQRARDALVSHVALVGERVDATRRGALAIRIGDLSARIDEPEIAAQWYRRGIGQVGSDVALMVRMAEAEWKSGHVDRAHDLVGKALTIEPENAPGLALRAAIDQTRRKSR
jgi:tetratricopeptide (TPR) repeat protein